MKNTVYAATVLLAALALVVAPPNSFAQEESGDWKSMKHESKRMKLDEMAEEVMNALFEEKAKAKELYENSYGWAVFDNLKLAFGISGGGGNGVASVKETNQKTYMKMGTGGVGLGLGANKYQVIFFFQDSQTYDNFVNKGWQADAGATASAGTEAAEVKTGFVNGIAIYQMTENGVMLSADIAGTKYWQNDKLN